MKATGIVRKADELGRVVIPKELRKTMNIDIGASLGIFQENDMIIFKKYSPGCCLCDNVDHVFMFRKKLLCNKCVEQIKTL